MRQTDEGATGYVDDPATGEPALSKIDEGNLTDLAKGLGVPYLHRTADDQGAGIVDRVRIDPGKQSTTSDERSVAGRTELYWYALLGVAALAAWEAAATLAGVLGTRWRRRRTEPRTASSAAGPPRDPAPTPEQTRPPATTGGRR